MRIAPVGKTRCGQPIADPRIFDEGVAAYSALLRGWSTNDIVAFTAYLDRPSEALVAAHEPAAVIRHSNSGG
jgi:hypothetical protein